MHEQALHLHIQGQVQGVGFRPFVYRLAREMGLRGWVNNGVDGVHIEVCGADDTLQHFAQRIVAGAPALARITAVHQHIFPSEPFPIFKSSPAKASARLKCC